MTDILANLGAQRTKRPHRHRWFHFPSPSIADGVAIGCDCGAIKDETASRRGRTSRSRGNAYERSVAARLGAQRVGQYGGKQDVASEWIAVQCKNGGAFPERAWRWLQELPRKADQLRAVVIGDAPGAGHRRREVIILDLDDFIDWFGKPEATTCPTCMGIGCGECCQSGRA